MYVTYYLWFKESFNWKCSDLWVCCHLWSTYHNHHYHYHFTHPFNHPQYTFHLYYFIYFTLII